jgi:hypothetical protein
LLFMVLFQVSWCKLAQTIEMSFDLIIINIMG